MGRIRSGLDALARLRRGRKSDVQPPFTGEMTIEAAWHHHPGAPAVFSHHHLPACDGCAVRFDETLAEATEAYGIELHGFLTQLNALLGNERL